MPHGTAHRNLVEVQGATWTGELESISLVSGSRCPECAARLPVLAVLDQLRRSATLAINAIHMSPLSEMNYNLLVVHRAIGSVANASRQDVAEATQ